MIKRLFQFVCGLAQIWMGLGFLGLVSGWTASNPVMGYIFGISFMGIGAGLLIAALRPGRPFIYVEPSDEVREMAINPSTRMQAIRAYRKQTGAGLMDAKSVVEGLKKNA